MRCWRPFSVVLALVSGCFTSNSGQPPAEEAPGGETSAQESRPWEVCRPTAVPLGPAPDSPPSESREWVHGAHTLLFLYDDPVHGPGLWRSSGSQGGGTGLVKRLERGPTGQLPSGLTPVGREHVFFISGDLEHGRELWVSDGTAAGTRMVKDLWPGAMGSFPQSLFDFNGVLYFTAGTPESGRELWRSDGTAEGTFLVEDLMPGPEGSSPYGLTRGGDGALYFLADLDTFHTVLMRTTGDAGAVELFRVPTEGSILESFTPVGRRLYFISGDIHEDGMVSLMMTEGGAAPVQVGMFQGAGNLVAMGGRLYFTAAPHEEGSDLELWRTDGTAKGTYRVKDMWGGLQGSNPSGLTVMGRRLFFAAEDGVHGRELWVSDGTEAGTQLHADVRPGAEGSSPEELAVLQGNLFFSADSAGRGREPWVSRGTPGSTRPLDEVVPGLSSSDPRGFKRSAWDAVFSAGDGQGGRKLWAVPMRPGNRCRRNTR